MLLYIQILLLITATLIKNNLDSAMIVTFTMLSALMEYILKEND